MRGDLHWARAGAIAAIVVLLLVVPLQVRASSNPPVVMDNPPVANAGPDQTVNEDTPMMFNGSASSDDVGIVNYTWILPGPVTGVRTLFTLQNGGTQAVFDPARPLLYVLAGQRVDAVNLTTGLVDRSFPLLHSAQYPPSLAISPRGAFLVVSIPTGSRGYYDFGPYESFIATVDLVNQTKLGEFFIPQDAMSAGVSDDGYAVVTGGSGQWADVRVYNARNGTGLPFAGIVWQYNRMVMHPSGRRVYTVETEGISSLDVERHDFNTTAGVSGGGMWPYFGSYPGPDLWPSDDGRLLVTASGMVLLLSDTLGSDMQYVYRLTQGTITAAAFDSGLRLIATAEGSMLSFYDMDTYDRLGWADLGGSATEMAFRGDQLLALVGDQVKAVDVPRGFLYGVTPSYTFTEPGTYVVILRVRDTAGQTASDSVTITVRDITPPVADAGPDQTAIHGTTVVLDGSASSDNVGIVSWAWALNDGGPVVLWGETVQHRFDNIGTYVVTLTVTDSSGNTASDTVTITVTRDTIAPTAVAGPDQEVFTGARVEFEGTNSTDNMGIASYAWTFTDNGPQTLHGAVASYRFSNPGVFNVTLTVTDLDGNVGADTTRVTVRDIVLVSYTHDAHGFRIGIPQGWDVQLDYTVGGSTADLIALGPVIQGRQASVVVASEEAAGVEESDAFLLSFAQDALSELQYQTPVIVLEGTHIVQTTTSHAAVFEVELVGAGNRQVWAILASASRHRVYAVVATVESGSAERFAPLIEAVIGSFEVIPPSPLENPLVLVGVIAVIIAAIVVVAVAALLVRRRRRTEVLSAPGPSPAPGVAAPSVITEPGAAPPAPEAKPAAPSPGPPPGRWLFCPRCGRPLSSLDAPDRFCPRCGTRVS